LELEEKYEDLLIEIHDSASERIEKNHVVQLIGRGRNNLLDNLNYLIEIELVEFDIADDSYYLTYEGYEEVDEIKELREAGEQMAEIEYQDSSRKSRIEFVKAMLGGIFIFSVLALVFIDSKREKKFELTPEILNQIEKKTTTIMDSIQNERKSTKE